MKGTSTAMKAELGARTARYARCVKLQRRAASGGGTLTFTEHDQALVDPVDGLTYAPWPGAAASDVASDVSLQAGNVNLTAAMVSPNPTFASMVAGDWDYAQAEVFYLCWSDPSTGRHFLKAGTVGELSSGLSASSAEIRGLIQLLSQSVVDVTQPSCRHRRGDGSFHMGGCNNDDTTSDDDYKVEGTLSDVSADGVTLESAAFVELGTPPAGGAGSFAWGRIVIDDVTSENNGRHADIKASAAGQVTLHLPFPYPLAVGTAFVAYYGCDGLRDTCIDTYDNLNNFDGEPDLPNLDKTIAVARSD